MSASACAMVRRSPPSNTFDIGMRDERWYISLNSSRTVLEVGNCSVRITFVMCFTAVSVPVDSISCVTVALQQFVLHTRTLVHASYQQGVQI